VIVRFLRRLVGADSGAPRVLTTQLHGFPVRIEPLAPHLDTAALAARLDRILAMADGTLPGHLGAARPHIRTLVVRRFPCRGAFIHGKGELLIELTFLADPARQDAEIGATLVHEMEHARLRGSGAVATMSPADEERRCRMVEIQFGERIPDGGVVLARAKAALVLDDAGVAPTVDWNAAWQRTRERSG
jgi:hypothetical protein